MNLEKNKEFENVFRDQIYYVDVDDIFDYLDSHTFFNRKKVELESDQKILLFFNKIQDIYSYDDPLIKSSFIYKLEYIIYPLEFEDLINNFSLVISKMKYPVLERV